MSHRQTDCRDCGDDRRCCRCRPPVPPPPPAHGPFIAYDIGGGIPAVGVSTNSSGDTLAILFLNFGFSASSNGGSPTNFDPRVVVGGLAPGCSFSIATGPYPRANASFTFFLSQNGPTVPGVVLHFRVYRNAAAGSSAPLTQILDLSAPVPPNIILPPVGTTFAITAVANNTPLGIPSGGPYSIVATLELTGPPSEVGFVLTGLGGASLELLPPA